MVTAGMEKSRPIVGRATVTDDAMNGGRNAARMETKTMLFLLGGAVVVWVMVMS
jgi:hypothetical protein